MIFNKSRTQDRPISRQSLAWLLTVQIFILVPHFVTAPLWIAAVWILVAIWRWKIFQGAWDYPNKLRKTLIVIAACAGLVFSLGAGFRFESMVSLLLVGFTLKLLELKTRTDFVLLIFIAFFLLGTQFVEFNNLVAALYAFGCLSLLCATLMQLYKESDSSSAWKNVRASLAILLQAIPFMVVLFIVVPRIGSFWAVPSPQHAKTGLSDSMSPGDFVELMESNELAFRVSFKDKVPAREKLYWRSLVFSYFDGRRWSQSREQKTENQFNQFSKKLQAHLDHKGNEIEYDVIAEPTGQPWLYALGAPLNWSSNITFSRDMRLQAYAPTSDRTHYHVVSSLDYQLNASRKEELAQNVLLPKDGNAQTRQRAIEWLTQAGSTEKLIEKLFDYYHQRFLYTLRPPSLGVDVVDDFLWGTQQGFCEHFSSSFVFFMRAAGIPARVVVGYQGGDFNSVDTSLSVRQRDAHAWAEVWIEGRGWVMFDPTAAIAPERIRQGIEQSLSLSDREYLGKPFGSSLKLIMHIREQWDAANLKWTLWIMNYDSGSQASFLKQLLGDVSPINIALVIILAFSSFGFVIFLGVSLRIKQTLPLTALLYGKICKKLKVIGFAPSVGETPRQFFERVASMNLGLSSKLRLIATLFERLTYADDHETVSTLKDEIRAFSGKA